MKRIFEPYYTKKKRMGMGIGLSIVHSIVDDHHGTIDVKNLRSGGAAFTISFPLQAG